MTYFEVDSASLESALFQVEAIKDWEAEGRLVQAIEEELMKKQISEHLRAESSRRDGRR